jgi:hypothetical protein
VPFQHVLESLVLRHQAFVFLQRNLRVEGLCVGLPWEGGRIQRERVKEKSGAGLMGIQADIY